VVSCGIEQGEGKRAKIRQLIIMFVTRSNGLAIASCGVGWVTRGWVEILFVPKVEIPPRT
jgi:hypothetical protein